MEPGSASRARRYRRSASSICPRRTASFAASTLRRDSWDRESGFSAGWAVADPGAGAEFWATPVDDDAAGGLPCEAQPQQKRTIEMATNGAKREGRVSMSSCLLGTWPEAKLSGVSELMLLGRDSRRPLSLFPLLGAEKLFQNLDAALRGLRDLRRGIDLHDLSPVRERLLEDLCVRERDAQVVVRFLIQRIVPKPLPVEIRRFGDALLRVSRVPQIRERAHVGGIDRERLLIVQDGFVGLAQLALDEGHADPRVRERRRELGGPPELAERIVPPSLAQVEIPQVEVRARVVGVQLERLPKFAFCVLGSFEIHVRRPETDMGNGIVGVESYRFLERQDGVLVAAGPAVGAAERQVGIGIFRRFFRKLKRFFDGKLGDCHECGLGGGIHDLLRGRLRMGGPCHEEYCNGAPKGDTFSERAEQVHGCL